MHVSYLQLIDELSDPLLVLGVLLGLELQLLHLPLALDNQLVALSGHRSRVAELELEFPDPGLQLGGHLLGGDLGLPGSLLGLEDHVVVDLLVGPDGRRNKLSQGTSVF